MEHSVISQAVHAALFPARERISSRTHRQTMNLRMLLQQLSIQPVDAQFDASAVASALGCSITTAYRYINTLMDAAIIDMVKPGKRASKPVPKCYRLLLKRDDVDLLLAALDNIVQRDPRTLQPGRLPSAMSPAPCSQVFPLFSGKAACAQLQPQMIKRDPLVAALFGPGPSVSVVIP
jgi:hypothetical protein